MDDYARFFDHSLNLNGIANAEGYFRRVNIAWERTLGWTADEVSASPWLEFVHPDDRQSTIDAGRRLFEGASIVAFENRYRCKDGSYRLIQWHAETVGSEAYCSGRDVTDERLRLVRRVHVESVDGLRERGPWFFAIFDNAPFAMALTAMPEGVMVSVNDAFLKLFEFARDDVLGRTTVDLGISDAESQAHLAAELRDRGMVRDFECVRRTKGGARAVLLLNVDPIHVGAEAYVLTSVRDVTRASAATAELRALVDNLPELAWTARPDGFIEFYNRRWYDYTGTKHEELQGWGWQSVHDRRELPRVMESWTRSIATRQPFEQTFPLRRKDGVFRWFLSRIAPIFDDTGELVRWVGINTDIDDQRRDQEALREAEQRFRLAIEAAPTGMLMMDCAGKIVLVNAQVERLFGYPRDELLGQGIEMLVPERFRARHPDFRKTFFSDPEALAMGAGRELHGLCKDGTEVPIEIGLNPLQTSEGDFVLSSVVDITQRKGGELERENLVGQLRTLNAELEERVRDRTSELSATLKERDVLLQEIHHRVKNNLQVISSLISMQVRQLKDASSRDALGECQTRVQAIALIHEKLYQSKDYSRVPFSDYARSLADNIFHATGVSPAAVTLELNFETLSLRVDKAIPCGLILNELITNALKHAFPNERRGIINVQLRSVSDRENLLSVSDDGIGLAESYDFEKSESLGMQLVSTLVEQLEGRLEIGRSNGTTFSVTFPAEAR